MHRYFGQASLKPCFTVLAWTFHSDTLISLSFLCFQVLTRFLCSSTPVLYWIPSLFLLQALSGFQRGVGFLDSKYFTLGEIAGKVGVALFRIPGAGGRADIWISRTVVLYFISYTVLGFTVHCNFYPWT